MSLDTDIHNANLIDLLKSIYSDSSLGPLLGFKGGTAAHLFYGLDRFSVDLDFDLLDPKKEEKVFEKIKKIAKKQGTIKEATNKRYTLFVLLSYSVGSKNIKIEINKRQFKSKYHTLNHLGIPMLVMTKRDMFTNKLVALTDRPTTVNRDIYDVYFFLKNRWEINKKMVEERTEMKFTQYLKHCIKFLEKYDGNILLGLGELIDNKQKDWIRENLLEDTIFQLKLKLDQLEK
ncbi:MAG: nucleotidyl transferase AbiEii/AbiGii toxin family protein [Elusimicrobiota bacterium]